MSKKSQKQKEQPEVKAEAPEIEGKNSAEVANDALAERAKTQELISGPKSEIRVCREDIKDVKHQMEAEIQYLASERAKTQELISGLKSEIRVCREDIKDVKHQMEVEIQYLASVCKSLSEEIEGLRGPQKPTQIAEFKHDSNEVSGEIDNWGIVPRGFRGRN